MNIHIINQSNYNGWTVKVNGRYEDNLPLEDELAELGYLDDDKVEAIVKKYYPQVDSITTEEDIYSS